jgi:hypothetical protein
VSSIPRNEDEDDAIVVCFEFSLWLSSFENGRRKEVLKIF